MTRLVTAAASARGITTPSAAFTEPKVFGAKAHGLVASSVSLLCGCALAMTQVPVMRDGNALVDADGMTLYTFDRDSRGKSECNAQCAADWRPLAVAAGARATGDYTIVVRDDGRRQWAYKGKPLYVWARDRKPGDQTGEAFDNVWRIARP